MKGVVFNLLEDFITEGWGADTYEDILSRCPLHTREPFIGPSTYPDADLLALVGKTCERLGVSTTDALHAFGRFLFPRLAEKVPSFLHGHVHPRTFLKTVDDVIHVEVKKLFKGALTPRITWEDGPDDTLVLHYQSSRKMCALFTGLLAGAGEHFHVPLEWSETACMHRGAERCSFDVTFVAAEVAA